MITQEQYRTRIANVQRVMGKSGVDCLLLNRRETVRYLTGADNTCSWVFLRREGEPVALVLESDYLDYRAQSRVADIRAFRPHDPYHHFTVLRQELGLRDASLALEKEHLRLFLFEMVQRFFDSTITLAVNADYIVEEARIHHTPDEIEKAARAAELACRGMEIVRQRAAPGMTELDLAREVTNDLFAQGAGSGTYIYLASDSRSSLAHNAPQRNRLERGPVVVDIHATYEGIYVDVARTFFLDPAWSEPQRAYDRYRTLVDQTVDQIRHGMTLVEIKKSFYRHLEAEPDWIILSGPLLHGVGVMNAELPKLHQPHEVKGYYETVEENMVLAFTNIGVYSKQGWGIRYEETFVVTKDRPVRLSAGA